MISFRSTSFRPAVASPVAGACGVTDFREVAHESALGTIVNSSVSGLSHMPSGYEPAVQLVLPYYGLFSYSIGKQGWLIDPTKILLIQPGWEFEDGQPVEGVGHASLLVNPAQALVDEMLGSRAVTRHGETWSGAAQSSPEIWLQTFRFLAESGGRIADLQADEWLIRSIEMASGRPKPNYRPSTRTVAKAKEFLHAHEFERIPLERIANAVGVSPVYLTQEFTRSEGVPLYQYQLYLRLIRSLYHLRDCDDITQLALELGFSSHSHFTATFGRTFGISPSHYRRNARLRRGSSPIPSFLHSRTAARLAC